MTVALITTQGNIFQNLLVESVQAELASFLRNAEPGQCSRISTLPRKTMIEVCQRLRILDVNADIFLLDENPTESWQATSTKLIELRNNEERPLMVFIPAGTRTSANDSIDISTFVEVPLPHILEQMKERLFQTMSGQTLTNLGQARNILQRVKEIDPGRKFLTPETEIRYYISYKENGGSHAALGGSLYQLGLFPDFELANDPGRIAARLATNQETVIKIQDPRESLLVRLHNLNLVPNTIQTDLYNLLRYTSTGRSQTWTTKIATDPQYNHLSFDKLPWLDMGSGTIELYFTKYSELPLEDNLAILDLSNNNSLIVYWSTNPPSIQSSELDYFRIEFVNDQGAVSEYPGIVKKPKHKYKTCSKKLTKLDKLGLEEGLYFIRVRAFNDSNQQINDEIARDLSKPDSQKINESDLIWVTLSPGPPPPPPPTRNQAVKSYAFALFEAAWNQFITPDSSGIDNEADLLPTKLRWETSLKKGVSEEALFTIAFDEKNVYSVATSPDLRLVETETLKNPAELGRWLLDYTEVNTTGGVNLKRRGNQRKEVENAPLRFLNARRNLFRLLSTASGMRIKEDGAAKAVPANETFITSIVDLTLYSKEIQEYVVAYNEWLSDVKNLLSESREDALQLIRDDPNFLDLDVLEVKVPYGLHNSRQGLLLSPTHPVRLLWHLQEAFLIKNWTERITSVKKETARRLYNEVRQALESELSPVNIPPMLFNRQAGQNSLYIDSGTIGGHFWQLYLATNTKDTHSVRASIEQSLGLFRTFSNSGDNGQDQLTHKLLRYLYQHPYVDTLKINVFNPGDGLEIVDSILKIQASFSSLKYQVRLFSESSDGFEVGEAFENLLNPQRQISENQDDFVAASRNHLFPKLKYSRNSLFDFLKNPENYEAHVSFLLNFFPVVTNLSVTNRQDRSSFVYGLSQELRQIMPSQTSSFLWQQNLYPQPCKELPGSSENFRLSAQLAEVLENFQILEAIYSEGRSRAGRGTFPVPVIELDFSDMQKRFIYLVHQYSDWVLTVDRNLGLEYFDGFVTPSAGDQPIYLLDHTPEYLTSEGERLLLTTRSSSEIIRLVQPSLLNFRIPYGQGQEELFLNSLRSLSGKLVLKLLSSYTHREEVTGLVLAQLFLQKYGLLQDRFVIPLDAHSELFTTAQKESLLEQEISLKRTDLALVQIDSKNSRIHFRLVEVKARQTLLTLGALAGLSEQISDQLKNSIEVLRKHFDPVYIEPDRLDRPFKVKELANLLSYYLERGIRHKLLSRSAADEMRKVLNNLDNGYTLEFEQLGLIFEFNGVDLVPQNDNPSLPLIRVGRDYINKLLERGGVQKKLESSQEENITEEGGFLEIPMQTDPTFNEVTTFFQPHTLNRMAQILEERRKRLTGESQILTTSLPIEQPVTNVQIPAEVGGESNSASPTNKGVNEIQSEDHTERSRNTSVKPAAQNGLGAVIQVDSNTAKSEKVEPEKPPVTEFQKEDLNPPTFEVLLGDNTPTPQFGILGRSGNRTVAIDLNGCNTISLFGVQGGGKSYTLGSIVEMATKELPKINQLPSPLATVIFHYNESQDYAPEFVTMVKPNSKEQEIQKLADDYGAKPASLDDVLLLTTPDKLVERQEEFPSIRVEPIYFHSSELSIKDWKFLMSAVSNQSMYITQITMIMRKYRSELTLDNLLKGIEASSLNQNQKELALMRLNFAGQFINDSYRLAEKLKPGRMIIVDVRDELIEQDEALGLFVVMLNIFANAGRDFNKLVVFDEAHKYMSNQDLTSHIVEVVRQMRHQGVSIMIASQDPPSLPLAIIELSSIMLLHRFNSANWLKHIQKAQVALDELTPVQLVNLMPGEAYTWANKSTDQSFTSRAVKVKCRPRVTQHGGSTKTAISR